MMTDDDFDELALSHTKGEIHEMLMDVKALRDQRDCETDPAKREVLNSEIASWAGVITARMRDIGRDDDDFINDSVFHAR